MKQVLRYILLAAVIIGMLYAYFAIPEKPETGVNFTPKELIETIEQKKEEERSKAKQPSPENPSP